MRWNDVATALLLHLWWILILHSLCVESVGGIFELRLLSFNNPFGVDDSGVCCNTTVLSSISSGGADRDKSTNNYGVDQCICSKTKFRICVKHYQVSVDPEPPCYIGETVTNEVYDGNQIQLGNIFTYDFKFRWPGTFSLIIEAWQQQQQELNQQPQLHQHQQLEERRRNGGSKRLITRMAIQQFLGVGDPWRNRSWTGRNNQTFSFDYRVRCLPDYYGDGCDKYCKGRNDTFGHYICGEGGEVQCLDGWTGVYCEKPNCLTSCHPSHGYCREPHTCVCHAGWTGADCSECIRYPGCKHGRCTKQWDCECEEGWGGLFCNQDLNYCTNHRPCKNGGTCFNTGSGSFTCKCSEGFSGIDCSIFHNGCEAEGTCLNGGTCRENGTASFCLCREGWTGGRCQAQIMTCSETQCSNGGTCVEEQERVGCLCRPGYGGATCDVLLHNDHQSCPCLNGDSCVDGNCLNCSACNDCNGKCENGRCMDGKCICNLGYSGEFCTEKVNICGTLPCANGGSCIPKLNSFECLCVKGFGGLDCSDPCDCLHGKCVNSSSTSTVVVCQCEPGYSGDKCQFPNTTFTTLGLLKELEEEESRLSTEHVVLVVCVSVATPILVVLAVGVVVLLKKRRRDEMRRNDEVARRQNQVNTVQCLGKGSDPHMILNSLDCNRVKISNLDLRNSIGRVSSQTFHSSMCSDFQEREQRNNVDVATDYPRWVANAVHHSPVIHNNNRLMVEDQKLATTV